MIYEVEADQFMLPVTKPPASFVWLKQSNDFWKEGNSYAFVYTLAQLWKIQISDVQKTGKMYVLLRFFFYKNEFIFSDLPPHVNYAKISEDVAHNALRYRFVTLVVIFIILIFVISTEIKWNY